MDQDAYVPVDDLCCEEFYFLAAVFEATARRADALDAGNMDLDVADHIAMLQSSLADLHDPDRTLLSMAAPKRFYRRNWQSFSLRLKNRCRQTAKSSKTDTMNLQVA